MYLMRATAIIFLTIWLSTSVFGAMEERVPQQNLATLNDFLEAAFLAATAQQRPTLAHIGIQGETIEQGFLVTAVLEDYPAFNAEIYRGDIIKSADGESFHPIKSFASRAGEPITLSIIRGDSQLSVSVTPVLENLYDSYRTATLNSVQEFSAGNKVVGYLRPWALSKNTGDLVSYRSLMEQLDHCDALILDLRNAYGFLDQTHIDSLISNNNGVAYFEKTVVILFNTETAAGPMTLVESVSHLQRIDSLSADTHLGVTPELRIDYPKTQTSRYDPQYDAALNRLLGII